MGGIQVTLVLIICCIYVNASSQSKCYKEVKIFANQHWKYMEVKNAYATNTRVLEFGDQYPKCMLSLNREEFIQIFGRPNAETDTSLVYYLRENKDSLEAKFDNYTVHYSEFIFNENNMFYMLSGGSGSITSCPGK